MDKIAWPQKTREIHNHHMDSTVWNDFQFRDDDIVIGTYAKSGTTWTQQIVGQLVFQGAPDVNVAELSPWVDLRVPPKDEKLAAIEGQTHRRFLKTHLPVDALVFSPKAKYLYIGRDGRDVLFSLYNHHVRANDLWYELLNDSPGRIGPPIGRPDPDVRSYFRTWLSADGHPFWPFWENIRSWWAVRALPNVRLVHFDDLKRDLPGSIRQIADFLGIALSPRTFETVVNHCTFEYMKRNAALAVPLGGAIFDGGAETFIHKGTNGRWRDVLSPADITAYEDKARAELPEACARWLATGRIDAAF